MVGMPDYTVQGVSGYAATNPPDDGSQTDANEITWARHRTQLTNPLKTAVDAIETELESVIDAIAPMWADTTAKTSDYTVTTSDDGQLFTSDDSGGSVTFTLPAAAVAGDGFRVGFARIGSGANITVIDASGTQKIGTLESISLVGRWESVSIVSNGTLWIIASRYRKEDTNFSIRGLTCSTGTDADHDINIAAGAAAETGAGGEVMHLPATLTKRIDAAWAVGSAAGGLDTGSVGSTTMYAVWLIMRSDTSIVDALFSTSFTSPTLPTNYDFKRLIGAVATNSSSNIVTFTQVGDYFRYTGDVIKDVADTTISQLAFEVGTLSVPPSSLAHVYFSEKNPSGGETYGGGWLRTNGASDSSDTEDMAMYIQTAQAFDQMVVTLQVLVDSSSRVQYAAYEASGATTVAISTVGFTMLTRSSP